MQLNFFKKIRSNCDSFDFFFSQVFCFNKFIQNGSELNLTVAAPHTKSSRPQESYIYIY